MNEIKITTELCAEDRARIDRLTEALEKQAPIEMQMTEMPLDIMAAVDKGFGLGKLAETKDHGDFVGIIPEGTDLNDLAAPGTYKMETGPEAQPLPTAPEEPETPAAPEEPAAPQHTVAELQQKVINIVAGGADKKAAVATIIKQYAAKVAAIPVEKADEVWDKLSKLEG